MNRILAGLGWGAVAVLTSCAGGTETDNPATTLTHFATSGCKNRELDGGQQGLSRTETLPGVQCVEWQWSEPGALVVRLLNFPEACGESYLGKAARVSGVLQLSVHTGLCAISRCGTCVYDFAFEVRGVPRQAPLRVELGSALCESAPASFPEALTLRVHEAASGTVCRPLARSAALQYGRETGTCGGLNMPCGDCEGVDQSRCEAGLTCASIESEDDRCLAPCETDQDCELAKCEGGLCVLPSDF